MFCHGLPYFDGWRPKTATRVRSVFLLGLGCCLSFCVRLRLGWMGGGRALSCCGKGRCAVLSLCFLCVAFVGIGCCCGVS